MAEYRELPMVMGSAKRSSPVGYVYTDKYTLNAGHVKFFYSKKSFLLNRWLDLIAELYDRGYNIDPAARVVNWRVLDKFPQHNWEPDQSALQINRERIQERILSRLGWYKHRGVDIYS